MPTTTTSPPPPDYIVYVAEEPPKFERDPIGGQLNWISFRVHVKHLTRNAPAVAAKLAAECRDVATMIVCHADAHGNIVASGLREIDRIKPDAIYCCHPGAARRVRYNLPIQGWHNDLLLSGFIEGTRVVSIARVVQR